MAYKVVQTEHSGAKKGKGAYWGVKADAKKASNKARREHGKRVITSYKSEGQTYG